MSCRRRPAAAHLPPATGPARLGRPALARHHPGGSPGRGLGGPPAVTTRPGVPGREADGRPHPAGRARDTSA